MSSSRDITEKLETACKACGWYGEVKVHHLMLSEALAEIISLRKRFAKAERSLKAAGFEDRGGEAWKPPMGPNPFKIPRIPRDMCEHPAIRLGMYGSPVCADCGVTVAIVAKPTEAE